MVKVLLVVLVLAFGALLVLGMVRGRLGGGVRGRRVDTARGRRQH
jgi:hypothetical protein